MSKLYEHPNCETLMIYCPACDSPHAFNRTWTYNGNPERPTVTPSVLANVGGKNPTAPICHSFISDGNIQYLGDCTHTMAGQTIELPEFPDKWK